MLSFEFVQPKPDQSPTPNAVTTADVRNSR
jgi:hypothetical protein